MQDADAERQEDEAGRRDQEIGGEQEPDLANHAVKEAVGVERLEPQVEQAAPNPRWPIGANARKVQQAEPPELPDEPVEGIPRDGGREPLLDVPAGDFERR